MMIFGRPCPGSEQHAAHVGPFLELMDMTLRSSQKVLATHGSTIKFRHVVDPLTFFNLARHHQGSKPSGCSFRPHDYFPTHSVQSCALRRSVQQLPLGPWSRLERQSLIMTRSQRLQLIPSDQRSTARSTSVSISKCVVPGVYSGTKEIMRVSSFSWLKPGVPKS
jgi:hypothetical protein